MTDGRVGVQVPVEGSAGLLNRLVKLRVLVGTGDSLEVSHGEDPFGVCGSTINIFFFIENGS